MKSEALIDHKFYFKNINFGSHVMRYWLNPGYRIIYLFRLGGKIRNKVLRNLFNLYYRRQKTRFLITLPLGMTIGKGLFFPHGGPIVVAGGSKIGEFVVIHPNVLLGGNRKGGGPKIGNNVFIGNGAKLIGNITIGDYVFISPNATITKDISSDSVVGAGVNNILRREGGKFEVQRYQDFIN